MESHPKRGSGCSTAVNSEWTSLVAELCALWSMGVRPVNASPQSFAHILECQTKTASQVKEEMLNGEVPQRIDFELSIPTPLWRLSAAAPMVYAHCDGALPCNLKVEVRFGGKRRHVRAYSPGVLGKVASTAVTQAAAAKLSQLYGRSEFLEPLVDWLQETELYEFVAASIQAETPQAVESCGHVRAFIRFHHVLCMVKQSYMRMWASDVGVAALLSTGQPAMLLVEGPKHAVEIYRRFVTTIPHWGPTPARLVASAPVYNSSGTPLPRGLSTVSAAYPDAVTPTGTYNQRDCVDFKALSRYLGNAGHNAAAQELSSLADWAFAHNRGRVKESGPGAGWVGYATPEPQLCAGGDVIDVPESAAPASAVNIESLLRANLLSRRDSIESMQIDEDPELTEAIRLSLGCSQPIPVDSAPSAAQNTVRENGSEAEDPDLAEAIRMSLQTSDRVNGVVLLE